MCCRVVLILFFMCVIDSEARVVNNFKDCSQFFFKNIWPMGLENTGLQTNYKYICQQYKGLHYFATLYMTKYRIPLFSAYRLDKFIKSIDTRKSDWFIEPQLFRSNESADMSTDTKKSQHNWKEVQAVNADYPFTNYDRGHLNPRSFQCNDARIATFTLTNAVPQNPCFNRYKWKAIEQKAKNIMREKCNFQDAQRFFVTGVIPSSLYIPVPGHDLQSDRKRDYYRVNVPQVMWTAACCYSSKYVSESFSFSYTGSNIQDSHIDVISVPDLNRFLNDHGLINAKIFTDDCFPLNANSLTILNDLQIAQRQRPVNANTLADGKHDLSRREQNALCVVLGLVFFLLMYIIGRTA